MQANYFTMTISRENFTATINHRQPERVVVDFGASPVTGIHVSVVEKLRQHYGLKKIPVKVIDSYQMLGEVDCDLAEAMGIDVVGFTPRTDMFGIESKNWKELITFWGQTVLLPGDFNTKIDNKGDLLIYPEGDTTVPASGKMPKSSFFFDSIIRQEHINEAELDPKDNLEEFGYVSELDLNHWRKQMDPIRESDKAILANFGGTALGDIALVPAPFLKYPKGIRDIAEWYMSSMIRPDYVRSVFEGVSEMAVENLKKYFEVVGNSIDVVYICGTDFGTQDSTFCAPELFDDLWLPYYKRINNWIHENTHWKTFKHSCGAVETFMSRFIEAGFDIINPVQITASGMDPVNLKEKYGKDLVFWGAGIDTQQLLPFGSAKEVKKQVLKHCDIFNKNGGFVFNSIHNVQAGVPTENIIAVLEAIKEYNGQ